MFFDHLLKSISDYDALPYTFDLPGYGSMPSQVSYKGTVPCLHMQAIHATAHCHDKHAIHVTAPCLHMQAIHATAHCHDKRAIHVTVPRLHMQAIQATVHCVASVLK